MKTIQTLTLLAGLATVGGIADRAMAAEEDGVAVAIVYDTSGSMKQSVRDTGGKMTPKFVIAERALRAVVERLQRFSEGSAGSSPRRLDAGLFVFSPNGAREFVKFARFDPARADAWTRNLPKPSTGTPLGSALQAASETVLKSPLSRKHVLVITDGINTVGPDPASVLPGIKKNAGQKGAALGVHFVAFDVEAKLFDPVKRLGVTVVGAANETQLNAQLGFILEKKILLEDEEPAPKPKTN